jgi:hypothetical protein
MLQAGQTKPFSHRMRSRYAAHAASSGNSFWNCGNDLGKASAACWKMSGTTVLPQVAEFLLGLTEVQQVRD